jgi:hypothetical protein
MNPSGFDKFEDRPCFATHGATFTFFLYEILRSEIIEENTRPFLEFWDVDRIAAAGRLHEIYGKVMFSVSGYDDDERDLFVIPEVRKFIRKLVTEWPYFFYADCLEGGFLADLVKCILPSLTVTRKDACPQDYKVAMKKSEIEAVYLELCQGLMKVCPLDHEMNQDKFDLRLQAVKAHLTKGLQ